MVKQAFTVGHRELDVIQRYVEPKEEHHLVKTFQEELAGLLAEAGVEFVRSICLKSG